MWKKVIQSIVGTYEMCQGQIFMYFLNSVVVSYESNSTLWCDA